MIARRSLLGGALALMVPGRALAAGLPVPPGGRLGFDVWRGSRQLGTHDLVFHPSPDGLLVDVNVDIAFRVGPITLFRYTHQARERWAQDQVVQLSTRTSDNGTRYRVEGHRDGRGLVVEPEGKPAFVAPANALPATHWNQRELDGPWINTQNGELIRPHVAPQGLCMVETATAIPLRVRRYTLTGPVQLTLWYDEAQIWAGLSFVKGGAEVRYARRS
jgi:hypothetical protein